MVERKRAEGKQRDRKLRAISSCNQALLRAEDEQALLDDICRIICEEAGYHMAWVGYVEYDEACSVIPLAWAGPEDSSLLQAGLTWADTADGHRPLGIAVRTGETSYIQDFSNETEAAQWIEHALHYGYRSAIALPLKRDRTPTFGVLCIYSAQTHAFSNDEVGLLEELAADLAFGITALRLKADRLEAERQLVASEQLFRTMIENSPDYIARYDTDLCRVYINPALQRLFKEPVDKLIGTSPLVSSPLLEPERYMADIRQVIETATECLDEVCYADIEGNVHWSSTRFAPEFDANDNVTSVLVISHDITSRKQAEEQMLQSEQRLRLHAELSPLGFLEWDENFCVAEWNAACEKIFGYTREEAIGRHAKDLILTAEVHDVVDGIYRDLMNQAGGQHSINKNVTKDGRIIICEWFNTTLIDQDGKAIGVASICNDITGSIQAEEERKEHLHFLESIDRINLILQEEGDIEKVMNRALEEVLDIVDCDRAYLQYPCDPDAPTWSVPMERTRPEYPGAHQLGLEMPMSADLSKTFQAMLDSSRPLQIGVGTEYQIDKKVHEEYSIRSLMSMVLRPKVDKPWQFGIHQCSRDRIWSNQEVRLFEEIGHRLSDGLNSLLIMRNLRESEERYRTVFENSPVPIQEEDYSALKTRLDELKESCGEDIETYILKHPEVVQECVELIRLVDVNRATLDLYEAESKAEVLRGLPQIFTSKSHEIFRHQLVALARGHTELLFDGALRTLKGRRREVNVYISISPGHEQSMKKVLVSLIDVTERKRSEERLRLAASVFATSQEGILISDADNQIVDVNPAFTRLTGYTRDEVLGQKPHFLSTNYQSQECYAKMWQALNTRGRWRGEIVNRRKSGEEYIEQLSIVAVKDEQDRLQHYVGAFSDISLIKAHEADLDRIAHYDILTSVPNRRLLGDRMEQAIGRARRLGKRLAVCYLDLDGFKPINDQFGHEGGDRMLVEISRRLQSMSRSDDTVARLGGDEFVLLWNGIEHESECYHALERILKEVSAPMMFDGVPVSVSVSIGVTLYPDDNVDADSLLRHADHAMYSAKQLGKNRYQMFDARLERQISSHIEFLDKVAQGLDKDQFELYYQPKADCIAGTVNGVEALLRWNEPILGLVGPHEFLPLIENDSLAFRMGRWVMEQAVRQAKLWNDMGITLPISINIFPYHLKYPAFIDDLHNAITQHWPQMPKGRLLMEIVETADLEELGPIEHVINECLKMGIGFSLDDFGTGYSSLIYLRRLSVEELKIDRSFIRDMLVDPEDEAIVTGVIGLGHAFGLRVVAEGVESSQQAKYLVNLGCSVVQGYGLGRPMPAALLQEWYADFLDNGADICR